VDQGGIFCDIAAARLQAFNGFPNANVTLFPKKLNDL
jgi:hypothetical protein